MTDAVFVLGLDLGDLPANSQRAQAQIGAIGTSARQTAAAMRQLPAQFTDIATQLAGGSNPFLVLLQQGGQIKDSFGGIGPAISGIGAAISPVALAVGALGGSVAALAAAAYLGTRQDEALRDSIALTGNAAGLTSARLQALAESTAASTQQTVGASRDIVLALASTGQVSAQVLGSMATAVARVADVSGQDAKKVAADFATMSGGVAKWAAEHNKAWNFITVEQYRYIRRLEEQKKYEEAARFVSQRITEQLQGQQQQLGYLEGAWNIAAKAASSFWQSALGLGREQTVEQQLEALQRKLAELPLRGTGKRGIEQEREDLREKIRLLRQAAAAQQTNADLASKAATANRQAIAEEIKTEGKRPEFPFGAIRNAAGQYRQDFLRSEKAAYEELAKAAEASATEQAKAEREALLQRFRTDREEQERQQRRLDQAVRYLEDLNDANERAAIGLIEDERARGEALIALDRQIAQRRAEAMGLTGTAMEEAQRLLDEQALAARRTLEAELGRGASAASKQAGDEIRADITNALAAAFRDSRNPLQAFANALGNAIFTRVSARLADALATAAVGQDGRGGLLGDIIGLIGSISGGGISVDPGGYGINNTGGSLPTRGGMATGTNLVPRDMIVKVHRGEAIVPARYNPAAGGAGSGMRAPSITQVFNVDARADVAQMQALAAQGAAAAVRTVFEEMKAEGR